MLGFLFAIAGLTDYAPAPPPPVTLPPAGESYVDPVFGTTIIRVTDSRHGTHCVNAYGYWPAFNQDGTRILIACDDEPLLFDWDEATLAVALHGPLQGDDGAAIEWEGAIWSYSEPNIVWALGGTRLWRIDVDNPGMAGYTLVHDFAGVMPYAFTGHQLHMSVDERVFTFHTRAGGEKLDAVVWDRLTGETWIFDRAAHGDYALDETKIDKGGTLVMVNGADSSFKLWDFRGGAVDSFDDGDVDDKPGGHADLGYEWMVNSDGWNTGLVARRFDNPHGAGLHNIVRYLRPDGSLNWSIADHVSMRADAETFVIGSTYSGDGTWAAFEHEIYLAYLDGSGFVRLAHSRSEEVDPNWRYWAYPKAVVDRRGHAIIYSSDLGQPDRIDVMLLLVPEDLRPPDPGTEPTPDAGPPDPGTPDAGSPDASRPPVSGASSGGCAISGGAPEPFAIALLVLPLAVLISRRCCGCLTRKKR